jgi:hypothetical protein
MRRIVRPFIKEFKAPSSKSAPRTRPVRNDGNGHAQPSSPAPSAGESQRSRHEDSYKAALEAADAVFGRKDSGVSVRSEIAAPIAPKGRVLPSLIEQEDALTIRLKAAAEKTHRGRKPGKTKTAAPTLRKKPALLPRSKAARDFVIEQFATSSAPEKEIVSASSRKRRSIRERWVLKTELMAGEKWKRRLRKAAR